MNGGDIIDRERCYCLFIRAQFRFIARIGYTFPIQLITNTAITVAGLLCSCSFYFFSRHLLMLVIIAVQFEISGKPRQKNIRFLYLSLGREITRVRDLCHICIFMMCALRCDLCFNVLLRLTESNRNIRAVCQVHKLLEIRLKLRFFTGFNIYMSTARTLVPMSIIMLRHFTFFVNLNGCDQRIKRRESLHQLLGDFRTNYFWLCQSFRYFWHWLCWNMHTNEPRL